MADSGHNSKALERVLLQLPRDVAELLRDDAEAAMEQLLGILMKVQNAPEEAVSDDFVRKMAGLLDAKRSLKQALEEALKDGD